MAIEYKVIPRKIIAGAEKGQTKYYASANNTGHTSLDDLGEDIESATSLNSVDVIAVLGSLLEVVPKHLKSGNIVDMGDIGSFRISISSTGEATADKVNAHSIKEARIIFTAGKKFKKVLTNLTYKKI